MPLSSQVDLGTRDHLLYELARDLSSSLELDVVLGKVMDRVITLMKAARGFIVLVDPDTNVMSVQMSAGEADEARRASSWAPSRSSSGSSAPATRWCPPTPAWTTASRASSP